MKAQTEDLYRERMQRVLLFVQEHLDETLDCARLADVACFSPCHFHRIFSAMTGESVAEYVRRLKLERAARQLRYSGKPVALIAGQAGYENPESFTRAFRQLFSSSPTKYRASKQAESVHSILGINESGAELPEVQQLNLPLLRVAFVNHVGDYWSVGTAWQRVITWAEGQGLQTDSLRLFGLPYDDPAVTPVGKRRYDACIVLPDDFLADRHASDPAVRLKTIGGGAWAVMTHSGPYQRLEESYARLFAAWLPQSGCETRDEPCLEEYLNTIATTPPDKLLTNIYLPIG